MEPGFSDHVGQAKLVDDFAAAVATIVAIMDVEDILRGSGQGPQVVPSIL